LRRKHLLRSKDRNVGLVRIAPELRARVRFRRINLLHDDFGMREPMDVIFCRNVFIYFDRPTQQAVLNRFCRHLVPGGYVFLGHSETINGLDVPLAPVAPTVYRNRR
jgi:chemotaxis protein methyltransferase CheR